MPFAGLLAHGAQATQLDVKPGQWEMTTVIHMDGGLNIPPEALARMPPAAQAQMKAMLNSMAQPQISKSCITEEELKRGFNLNHKMDAKCHQTTVNLSSSAMEIGETCAYGDGSATMHGKFEAVDRATLHGSVEVDRASTKGPKHMVVQFDGRWLGAACDGTEDSAGGDK